MFFFIILFPHATVSSFSFKVKRYTYHTEGWLTLTSILAKLIFISQWPRAWIIGVEEN